MKYKMAQALMPWVPLGISMLYAQITSLLLLPFHSRLWKLQNKWHFSFGKSFILSWRFYCAKTARSIWRWSLDIKDPSINKLVRVKGEDYFKDALGSGRGIILVSVHTFSFHLFQLWIGLNYGSYQPYLIKEYKKDQYIIGERQQKIFQGRLLHSDTGLFKAVKVLKNKGLIILCQDVERKTAESIDFLGKERRYPLGAARMAEMTDALIVPVIIAGDFFSWNHVVHFWPPLDPRNGFLKPGVVQAMEEMVMKYLGDWENV